jgi:hypothetical protein
VKHEIAGERHQQVLAARADRLDRAAGEGMVVIDPVERRQRRFEARDEVTGQRPMERLRGAEDRVTFRHDSRQSERQSWLLGVRGR